MTLHNALANSELHEDKGASTATDMQAYVADGARTGAWASPVAEVVGTWDYSTNVTSIDFEGLGDYAIIQIDLVGVNLSSNSDQNIYARLGNDSGYQSSSIYHYTYWDSSGADSSSVYGLPLATYRDSSPSNGLNFSSTLITNFNVARYKTAQSQEVFDSGTTTVTGYRNKDHFVRWSEAANKIRVQTEPILANSFTGGSIIISGYRYTV
jgi:hypothetical protein